MSQTAPAGQPSEQQTFFDEIGGHAAFERLVARFYAEVAGDPRLRPMYPEADLAPAAQRLRLFLEQYWGGPTTYSDLRGHPRLRLRHAPFPIDAAARDAWLDHMRVAVDSLGLTEEQDDRLWGYFVMAAFSMQNIDDPTP